MLKSAIEYLNVILAATGYFGTNYGLVVMVNKKDSTTDRSFPAEYCGQNQYTNVTDFDQNNGSTYWRMRSDIVDAQVYPEYLSTYLTQRTYPLKLVCVIKRDSLSTDQDNAYSEDKMSLAIQKELRSREKVLRTTLTADSVKFVFKGVVTDSPTIMASEFINIEMDRRSTFMMLSIDVDLIVEKRGSCLPDFCDDDIDVDAIIRNDVIVEITNDPTILTDAQTTLIEDTFCGASEQIDITINGSSFLTDVTVTTDIPVKNTAGTAKGSKVGSDWIIGDATATVKNSAATTITTSTIVADVDKDITLSDITLSITDQNANSFYSASKAAGVSISQSITFNIAYARQIPPQVNSNRTGDSAWLKANGYYADAAVKVLGLKPILTDWFTLDSRTPNKWGNTYRFTSTLGTQVYTSNGIVQDHYTGIAWLFNGTFVSLGLATGGDADSLGDDVYANCDTAVRASSFQGGTWRVPSTYEFGTLRLSAASLLTNNAMYTSYAPLSLDSSYIYWTSDGNPNNTGQMMAYVSASIGFISNVVATSPRRLIACRWIT